jgi:hypothetical protein
LWSHCSARPARSRYKTLLPSLQTSLSPVDNRSLLSLDGLELEDDPQRGRSLLGPRGRRSAVNIGNSRNAQKSWNLSEATNLLSVPYQRRGSVMKILPLTAALLLMASPLAAQTSQIQQPLGAGGQTNNSSLTNTGVICLEEMVATFCNVASSPNTRGYGSSAASGSSTGAGSSAGSGASGGSFSSSGTSTTSIHPCGAFPPPNELCN